MVIGIKGFQKGHKINVGRKFRPESIEKMKVARIGKKLSDSHRLNISKCQIGRVLSPGHRKKISEALIGNLSHRKPKVWTEESKKKARFSHKGEKSYLWKGEDADYISKHSWIRRWKGRPEFCEKCGVIGKLHKGKWSIHWANIDHKYRRVLEDYIGMCVRCHAQWDRPMKARKVLKEFEN
jgi:hypothetical protein